MSREWELRQLDRSARSLAHSLTQSLTDYITELPTFDCPVFTAQYAWDANGGVEWGGVGGGNPICVKYQYLVQFQS